MVRTLRHCAVPFALVLLFQLVSTPPALAAPGVGFHLSDWLDVLGRLWAPSGCILDPHGGCREGNSASARGEGSPARIWAPEGCIADPNGGCRERALLPRAEGCILDPGGNCVQ